MIFSCTQIEEMTFEFVDGELSDEISAHFERHVVLCAHCHLRIRSYRAVISIGRALPKRGPIPHSVESRLRASIETELKAEKSQ